MRALTEEERRALRWQRDQQAIAAKRARAQALLKGNASRRRELADQFAPLTDRTRRT